jgi:HlyD family secretion protein
MAGQIAVLEATMAATASQKASVQSESQTLELQISQVLDQLTRCRIQNPIRGILLAKYRETGEIASPGQALYKVANMDELILRAYISGNQLAEINTGSLVRVGFDTPQGIKQVPGTVTWISPRAEFTPKIIQTREERVNLVYAMKVRVPNEGNLKIGMPGEVTF